MLQFMNLRFMSPSRAITPPAEAEKNFLRKSWRCSRLQMVLENSLGLQKLQSLAKVR